MQGFHKQIEVLFQAWAQNTETAEQFVWQQ